MGTTVARLVDDGGRHEVVARFSGRSPLTAYTDPAVLQGADVVVDFSHPDAVLDNVHRYCYWGQAAVIGTTGWYDALDRVRTWVAEGQSGLLYAPNFSLGVALLVRALEAVGPLVDRLPDIDPYVHEVHHTGKVDSPSGTALLLATTLRAALTRKTHLATETQHGRIDPAALHVTSTRAGHVVGRHTVGLEGPFEHLAFTHEARDRAVFAYGALRAAEWLQGRTGLFTLDDLLADWLAPQGGAPPA